MLGQDGSGAMAGAGITFATVSKRSPWTVTLGYRRVWTDQLDRSELLLDVAIPFAWLALGSPM